MDLGIIRGGGGFWARNSSRGGLGSRSAGIFIYLFDPPLIVDVEVELCSAGPVLGLVWFGFVLEHKLSRYMSVLKVKSW